MICSLLVLMKTTDMEYEMTNTVVFATHQFNRESLAVILSSDPQIEVTGTAADSEELSEALSGAPVDSVVIDITSPYDLRSGLNAARVTRNLQPSCRSILFADAVTDELILAANRCEVSAIIDRARPLTEVAEITRNGHNGNHGPNPLSSAEIRCAMRRLRENGVLGALELGETDRRILELLKEGCTDKEISDQIFLSPHTVRNRISRLLTVLGKSNRTQLAVMASRHDIGLDLSQ
jgi:DNA-binding NarL/FixJ family response regulator